MIYIFSRCPRLLQKRSAGGFGAPRFGQTP